MPHPRYTAGAPRPPRAVILLVAGLAGFAVAAIAGIAAASSLTLRIEKHVHDTNASFKSFAVRPVNTTESAAVGPTGFAVYTFQGETTHHIICKKTASQSTNCWGFWPPVSVKSAKGLAAQAGIKGKLGAFHNHGTLQATLGGQPLYYFTPDIMSGHKGTAQGDELRTFGSVWHLVRADPTSTSGQTTSQPTTTTSTTTTTTNGYPPGYTY